MVCVLADSAFAILNISGAVSIAQRNCARMRYVACLSFVSSSYDFFVLSFDTKIMFTHPKKTQPFETWPPSLPIISALLMVNALMERANVY